MVKTTKKGLRGYDGGKRIRGRKRHIVVDILGLLLVVMVHAAGIRVARQHQHNHVPPAERVVHEGPQRGPSNQDHERASRPSCLL